MMRSLLLGRRTASIEAGDPNHDLYQRVRHHFSDLVDVRCVLRKRDAFFLSAFRTDGQKVFLKCLNAGKGYERLKAEFDAAKRVFKRLSRSSVCSVPEAFACVEFQEGKGALLIEYVDLPRADRWFKWFNGVPALRRAGIRRAAWWLSFFHSAGLCNPAPIDDVIDISLYEQDFLRFAEQHGLLANGMGESINRLCSLSQAPADANEATTPVCHLHGDYSPSNIFLTRKQVIGYDYAETTTGSPYQDIAVFLVSLVWLSRPLFRKYNPQTLLNDRQVFVSAYGGHQTVQAQQLLDILVLNQIVKKVSKLGSSTKTARKRRADQKHKQLLVSVFPAVLAAYQP